MNFGRTLFVVVLKPGTLPLFKVVIAVLPYLSVWIKLTMSEERQTVHLADSFIPRGNRPEAIPDHHELREIGTRDKIFGKRQRARSSGCVSGVATGVAGVDGFFIVRPF